MLELNKELLIDMPKNSDDKGEESEKEEKNVSIPKIYLHNA